MQRGMDLLRDLLLEIEKQPFDQHLGQIAIAGNSEAELRYHTHLADDAGLIEAKFLPSTTDFMVIRITNAGHDFLDAAREDTRWNRAKEHVRNTAGTLRGYILLEFGVWPWLSMSDSRLGETM